MNENDTNDAALLRQVGLGFDIEAFLSGPVGRYLTERAESEINEAVAELCNADPEDPKAIRTIQNRIHRAESFQQWLAEGVQAGMQAEDQLQAQ